MKTKYMNPLLAAAFLLVTSSHANLIVNGSFEDPFQANGTWSIYSSIPGWTATVGGIEVRNNVAGVAQDGFNFVELDANYNSTMLQTVVTDIGQIYSLSYWYAPRQSVAQTSNGIELYFNSVLVDNFTSYSSTNNAWTERVFSVTGTGNDIITFKAVGTSDSYGGSIDNVKLAAVPEPTVIGLLLVGLLGLGVIRRRK